MRLPSGAWIEQDDELEFTLRSSMVCRLHLRADEATSAAAT
jgi:hypothetical protein